VQNAATGVLGKFRDCSPTGGAACLPNPFTDPNLAPSQITPVTSGFNPNQMVGGQQPQYVVEYLGKYGMPVESGESGGSRVELCSNTNYGTCGAGGPGSAGTGAGSVAATAYYRITARNGDPASSDMANRATVTLQSIYSH
jgi:hypothetical protein